MSFFEEPGDDIQQFTTFATAVDLSASATSPMGPVRGHAREIFINDAGSGTLQVTPAGSQGTARTLTVATGDRYSGKFITIGTSTNVSRLTVTW